MLQRRIATSLSYASLFTLTRCRYLRGVSSESSLAASHSEKERYKLPTTKAVALDRYGDRSVLQWREVEMPFELRDDQLLIRVKAASINRLDVDMRRGYGQQLFESQRKFPIILGRDCSGMVVEKGSGVWNYKVGDEVVAAPIPYKQGTLAEYCVVSEFEAAPKPKTLSYEQSASFPFVGLTAYNAIVEFGHVQPRQQVLLIGAGGGVGTFALQYLKYLQCTVTALCSTKHTETVKQFGADFVFDSSSNNIYKELRPKSFDVIIDAAGVNNEEETFFLLRHGGTFVTIRGNLIRTAEQYSAPILGLGAGFAEYLKRKFIFKRDYGINYMWAYFWPNDTKLSAISQLFDKGALRPCIDKVFPIGQFVEAFEYFETQKLTGKVVISLS
jgi:NADPH:quinone reductase-like Zn-dependent oxidoreductase